MILKIGTPVVCYMDTGTHEEIMTPQLGAIVDIKEEDNEYVYRIIWEDDEDSWYEEPWVELYWKQAVNGKMMPEEAERLDLEYG